MTQNPGNHTDQIVRGTAANGMIRALAITAPHTVQTAKENHGLSGVATIALGRLLMAGQLIGSLFKNEGENISLMIEGNGPLERLLVSADTEGNARGYASNPLAESSRLETGQPNVPEAIGQGSLVVVRNSPHVEPYVSETALINGTISGDLTAYYIISEQIPTVVELDVILDEQGNVENAGGFFIQLLPDYEESLLSQLENALASAEPLPSLLKRQETPESILKATLSGLDFVTFETTPAAFCCDCSRERSERTLLSLGAQELHKMVDDAEDVNIKCDFCGKNYGFTAKQIESLIEQLSC